ncbi:MAG: retroviral-like aspartic protease family protein [Cytophagales bacterium]
MGIVYTTLKIRNAINKGEFVSIQAKVDTGATMLVIPQHLADALQFPSMRHQTVKYANEKSKNLLVVWAVELEVCGRKGVFEAVVRPNKNYALLGAIPMEALDLIVEPASLGIYPNPRSPEMPMAEIESVN